MKNQALIPFQVSYDNLEVYSGKENQLTEMKQFPRQLNVPPSSTSYSSSYDFFELRQKHLADVYLPFKSAVTGLNF